MRKPGSLITRAEQKQHGLTKDEARNLEKRERRCGALLLGQTETSGLETVNVKQKKVDKKLAKKEAKRARKEGYAGRDMEAVLTDSKRSEILAGEMKKLMGWTSPWRVTAKGRHVGTTRRPGRQSDGSGWCGYGSGYSRRIPGDDAYTTWA